MSVYSDSQKLDLILQKLGAVDEVLNEVCRHQDTIEKKLGTPTATKPATTQTPPGTKATVEAENAIEATKKLFPTLLEEMLNFEDKLDYVQIKPKQFLGADNFGKVASVVRGVGGEYVSAGRDSHFRVYPKKRSA